MQYIKKEVSDEVYFLHADKHESLLQIDAMILMGIFKHYESSQNSKFTISLQYLKKEVRKRVELFCTFCKNNMFAKTCFVSYGTETSKQIRMQDSFTISRKKLEVR